MITIIDKLDGKKKLRRSYEDYIPLETSEPQEPQETTEPTQPATETQPTTETGEEIAIPDTSEPNEAEI